MKVYLAGLNCKTHADNGWYLAGGTREGLVRYCQENNLPFPENAGEEIPLKPKYILDSFYYIREWQLPFLSKWDGFLLDSGAFTFMNAISKGKKGFGDKVDFEDYTRRYADFINRYDIKDFFEMDLDAVVGYPEVRRLRNLLETRTGKQCIPVWHRSRGKEDFLAMVKDFPYVAVGGIVVGEIDRKDRYVFKWLIDQAHDAGARIHGLGYTSTCLLHDVPFDSVDSTSWVAAVKFATAVYFDGTRIKSVKKKDPTLRLGDHRAMQAHNFKEWIKYQYYMDHKYTWRKER